MSGKTLGHSQIDATVGTTTHKPIYKPRITKASSLFLNIKDPAFK